MKKLNSKAFHILICAIGLSFISGVIAIIICAAGIGIQISNDIDLASGFGIILRGIAKFFITVNIFFLCLLIIVFAIGIGLNIIWTVQMAKNKKKFIDDTCFGEATVHHIMTILPNMSFLLVFVLFSEFYDFRAFKGIAMTVYVTVLLIIISRFAVNILAIWACKVQKKSDHT